MPAAYIKSLSGSGVKDASSIARNICVLKNPWKLVYASTKPHEERKGSPNMRNSQNNSQ